MASRKERKEQRRAEKEDYKRQEDEWLAKQTVEVMRRRQVADAKKHKRELKKEARKNLTTLQKVSQVAAGAGAAVASWIGWTLFKNQQVEQRLDKVFTDEQYKQAFYEQIQREYAGFAAENNMTFNSNVWRENLIQELKSNGRVEEAMNLQNMFNQVESGVFIGADINDYLSTNNLMQYYQPTELTDTQVRQIYNEAFESVYGYQISANDLRGNLGHLYETCMTGDYAELQKQFDDYVLFLVASNSNYVSRMYTEEQLNSKLLAGGMSPDTLDMLSPANKVTMYRAQICQEMTNEYGQSFQELPSIIYNLYPLSQASDQTAGNFWEEYLVVRMTELSYRDNIDTWTMEQVLQDFGYTGPYLDMAENMSTNDYIFASVMENKYRGADCIGDDFSVNFNNTGTLTGQDLINYQTDVANYQDWLANGQEVDIATWLDMNGYLDQIMAYYNDTLNQDYGETYAPMMYGSSALCFVLGTFVVRKLQIHKAYKDLERFERAMEERGLTEEDLKGKPPINIVSKEDLKRSSIDTSTTKISEQERGRDSSFDTPKQDEKAQTQKDEIVDDSIHATSDAPTQESIDIVNLAKSKHKANPKQESDANTEEVNILDMAKSRGLQ